jgi:hypothetical protein
VKGFALVVALMAATGAAAEAQVGGQKPVRPTSPRTAKDTARRDSTRADSAQARELIKWEEPDSLTSALLTRPGYSVTRYQGVKVRFDATTHTLYLEGDPAGVGRSGTLLVGDTIVYNDSTKIVVARGDTLILRDPSRGSSDVIALGQMRYNVESRRGNVTNISTAIESGEKWYVFGTAAGFVNDTTGGRSTAFYARNGSITSCDDSIPDYHFQAKEIKLISKNVMVARPAVLYIGDVPVFWLPFIFQDMRTGRRSGLLTPRFGVNEIFRNSPSYRRHIDNFGYYFAVSDYLDAQVSLDWRSGAASTSGDPGWLRVNNQWQYRWLDRFITGRFGVSQLWQRDGNRNTAISWGHQQDFSQNTHLRTDVNYVTSTKLQRQNSFNANQALATIRSTASYERHFGPAKFSISGGQTQYPGREEVSREFPNFTISTPTLSLGDRFDWTPALTVNNSERLKVQRNGEFAFRVTERNGVSDSVRLTSDTRATTVSFSSPVKIFGFSLSNNLRVSDRESNDPERIAVIDRNDPSIKTSTIFARTFRTEVDFNSQFGLPMLLPTTLKLSPSISIGNVDPRSYWVRTQQSGGRFVHQSKRLSYGVSASPTLFALIPGIGGISRFRHSITPQISYSYAPAATVNPEFLAALNETPVGYLGALASNAISLSLSQVLEAKMKSRDTASNAEPRKVKILSVNFDPLRYDFERKRKTGLSGFTTDAFGTSVSTDLLPGFSGRVGYSLFQGNPLSDTAKFKPFRTSISASFNINGNSGIFGALTRLFGRAVPEGSPSVENLEKGPSDALDQRVAATPVAGGSYRNQQYAIPPMQTWQASFSFSSTRQRPPVGNADVVVIDPRDLCEPYLVVQQLLQYQACIEQQSTNPVGAEPIQSLTSGGRFVRVPARETLTSNMGFHITPKWSATWGTTYNFQDRAFASHSVSLQRELHDWRSVFAFNRAPNGNFAFTFFIALNAQPDLKFDYDKQTYRQGSQ